MFAERPILRFNAPMSPRVIKLPLPGGDRRHFSRELQRVERLHADLVQRTADAFLVADAHLATAHWLSCEVWNARQFIGGDIVPSPTIADAIHGGCELLEVRCKKCRRGDSVDLTDVVWPRDNPVHMLDRALGCRQCKTERRVDFRPDLSLCGCTKRRARHRDRG